MERIEFDLLFRWFVKIGHADRGYVRLPRVLEAAT